MPNVLNVSVNTNTVRASYVRDLHFNHSHDDVIKWKPFPHYWPFVRGIHRSPMKSLHKRQWRGALMYSLICAWINNRISTREAGNLRLHRAHYDVIVMHCEDIFWASTIWWAVSLKVPNSFSCELWHEFKIHLHQWSATVSKNNHKCDHFVPRHVFDIWPSQINSTRC